MLELIGLIIVVYALAEVSPYFWIFITLLVSLGFASAESGFKDNVFLKQGIVFFASEGILLFLTYIFIWSKNENVNW